MKIYDGSKIIPGVIVFLAIVSLPFWYNAISSQAAEAPQLTVTNGSTHCIESAQWMIDHHMQLLNSWRDSVVRENTDTYTASNGQQYVESLGTCLSCHSETEFCEKCHNYLDVNPTCWECHSETEGQTSASK